MPDGAINPSHADVSRFGNCARLISGFPCGIVGSSPTIGTCGFEKSGLSRQSHKLEPLNRRRSEVRILHPLPIETLFVLFRIIKGRLMSTFFNF